MTQEQIIEGNKLIAEFMEIKQVGCLYYISEHSEIKKGSDGDYYWNEHYLNDELKYHTSWDWLMPVYNKLSCQLDIGWKITSKGVNIYTHAGQPIGNFDGKWKINCPENVIVDAWRAVVEFIKWYNSCQKKERI